MSDGSPFYPISAENALIFALYDHITAVYVLIFGVSALMFTVYEGIFGNYEGVFSDNKLMSDVYDLIFGVYEGKIAGNEGIFGVLKAKSAFCSPEISILLPKTSVIRQKVPPDARLAGIKARNQTKARACHSTILLLRTIAG